MVTVAERLRAAESRVTEACGMLAGPAVRIEGCLPLLDDARRLLAGACVCGEDEDGAAGELTRSLARAVSLARHAAAYYRACGWPGPAEMDVYGRTGVPVAGSPAGRILAEV